MGHDDRMARLRGFFAQLVCASAGVENAALKQAFAATPRETFAGPGPWAIAAGGTYVTTPDDDPACLYQDSLIALDCARGLNIGMPSAHALWLDALDLKQGETIVQVGAGSGYYTAIIAHLVGESGRVFAYEVDPALAERAEKNLRDLPQVVVRAATGLAPDLPKADAIYVCAGLTHPSRFWRDALKPGGRLMFPLQPEQGGGGMLLTTRPERGLRWPARFISRAFFIGCIGAQQEEEGRGLQQAFRNEDWREVRSLRLDDARDATCWFAGDGWALSKAEADKETDK